MKNILIFLCVLTGLTVQNIINSSNSVKKVYVCPKNFVRIGRRCYFFSRNAAAWQDAFYHCRDRKSNIAIIKNPNQDRRIRKILSRPIHAIQERWLGGRYNWKKMEWEWAASGKPLTYQGFVNKNFTEIQKWHCIIMDPVLNYKWNTRSCLEKKPYICHTKSKVVTKNDIKTQTDRHLNEIPINNEIPSDLRKHKKGDISRPKKKRKTRRNMINNTTILLHKPKYKELDSRERRHYYVTNKTNDLQNSSIEAIKHEIFKEDTQNDLYPKPIVEKYSFLEKNED